MLHNVIRLTYDYTKLVVYHIFVLLLGIMFACLFAIFNGILNFSLVWVFGPLVKMLIVLAYSLAPAVTGPYSAVMGPMVDISARFFRQIRIKTNLDVKGLEKIPVKV